MFLCMPETFLDFEMNYVTEFLQDNNKVGNIGDTNLPFYKWGN